MLETFSIFECNSITNLHEFHESIKNINLNKYKSYKVGRNEHFGVYIVQNIKKDGVLTRLIRSNWQIVQHILYRTTFVPVESIAASREIINQAFQAITSSILSIPKTSYSDQIKSEWLMNVVLICRDMIPMKTVLPAQIPVMKKSRGQMCQYYQYIHSFFEINYYIMMHYYILCGSETNNLEDHLSKVLKDFLPIFKANQEFNELCDCVKYFFVSIQLITEKVNKDLFWNTFNKTLEDTDLGTSIKLLRLAADAQRYDTQFRKVTGIGERVQPNSLFLLQKFKTLKQTNHLTCDGMLDYLRIIEPLICSLWFKEDSIEVLQVFWEFFSKRLKLSNKTCTKTTPKDYLKIIDMILKNPTRCNEDFEFFVGILIRYFKEYPMQWVHMRGRIYSHLGPNKIKDLDDNGIRHVMVLFLSLSTLLFEEMEKKILWFVKIVPGDKKLTEPFFNIYLTMILKFVQDDNSLEKIAPPMLELLQEASKDSKHYHLIKNFLKQFELIINTSVSMELSQWMLLGPWLEKYHTTCYLDDLGQSLPIFLRLVDKCEDVDAFSRPHWEEFFKKHLLENLKQLSVKPYVPSVIGIIVARLALQYIRLTDDIFMHFTNDQVCPEIAADFLFHILYDYPGNIILDRGKQVNILQCWIRICFLTLGSQKELTNQVVKLDIIPTTMKCHLENSEESMEGFIGYFGALAKIEMPMEKYWEVQKSCELAFVNLDVALSSYLRTPTNERIVLQIYKYSSKLFVDCHRYIYSRSSCNTVMEKLVEVLILPRAFVACKTTLHPLMVNAIRRTWHTFFEAFYKMNTNVHETAERLMKEMVVKYVAEFPASNSPVMETVLDNLEYAETILSKISVGFLSPPMQQSEANILKAMNFITTLAVKTKSLPLFKIIIDKLLYRLFEVVIVHNLRSSALNVVKMICLSPLYKEYNSEFRQQILAIAKRHMPMYATFVFQLLIDVAKFVPDDIRAILGDIKNLVSEVEYLMGVGHCSALRLQLEALQNSVK